MRKSILMLVLASSVVGAAVAADRPEIGRYIKAYSSTDGVDVWFLRTGPRAEQAALVQVTGIDHPWDQRIHKLQREMTQRGVKYVMTVDGKQHDLLFMEEQVELRIPGMRPAVLTYNRELSARGQPQSFLSEYLDQSPAR